MKYPVFAVALFICSCTAQITFEPPKLPASRCDLVRQRELLNRKATEMSVHSTYDGSNDAGASTERRIDAWLAQEKAAEAKKGWTTQGNFLRNMDRIKSSNLFASMQALPKLADVGVNFLGMHDLKWVLGMVFKDSDLKSKLKINKTDGAFAFSGKSETNLQDVSGYMSSNNIADETGLAAKYTFSAGELDTLNSTQLFDLYEKRLDQLSGLLEYKPVALAAVEHTAIEWWKNDKVVYFEMYKKVGEMYTLTPDGSRVTLPISTELTEWSVLKNKLLVPPAGSTADDKANYLVKGFGIIMVIPNMPATRLRAIRQQYQMQKPNYPDLVSGFDVEGDGHPNEALMYHPDTVDVLREIKRDGTPLYLHVGLSHWPQDMSPGEYDQPPQHNLYEVLLLRPVRIMHGWNLYQHPKLMLMLNELDLPVTVAPIFNQMFGFSSDLRDHPIIPMQRSGISVQIGSWVPGLLGYNSVSYDYYMAYLGWGLSVPQLKAQMISNIFNTNMNPNLKMQLFNAFPGTTLWDYWKKWNAQKFCPPPQQGLPGVTCLRGRCGYIYNIQDYTQIKLEDSCTLSGYTLRFVLPSDISKCVIPGMGYSQPGGTPKQLVPCEITGPRDVTCIVPKYEPGSDGKNTLNGTWDVCVGFGAARVDLCKSINQKVNVYIPPEVDNGPPLLSCSTRNMTDCMMRASFSHDLSTNCSQYLAFAGCALDAQCVDMAKMYCAMSKPHPCTKSCPLTPPDPCNSGMCDYIDRYSGCDAKYWLECRNNIMTNKNLGWCSQWTQLQECAGKSQCSNMAQAVYSMTRPANVKPCFN